MTILPRGDPHHLHLRYDDLVIGVTAGDPSDLGWLREFLAPPFEVVGSGVQPNCTVVLTTDKRGYEDAWTRGPQDEAQIDCFALDGRMTRLPLWRSASDDQVIFDSDSEVFYAVDPASVIVRILARYPGRGARRALMKVVRELAMNHSYQSGRLVVHGAALVSGAGAIIIAGPKGAGKTTLLIHMLRQTKAGFASNDRLVVSLAAGHPRLRGMPTIVALRQATLEMFPDLHRRLLDNRPHYASALGEVAPGGAPITNPDRDGRFSVSPAQFCELLQVTPVVGGPIRAVVFPQVRASRGAISIRALRAESAAARLMNALFRAGCPERTSSVFVPRGNTTTPDQAFFHTQCARLASEALCLECDLGPDAYTDKASTTQLLARLDTADRP